MERNIPYATLTFSSWGIKCPYIGQYILCKLFITKRRLCQLLFKTLDKGRGVLLKEFYNDKFAST